MYAIRSYYASSGTPVSASTETRLPSPVPQIARALSPSRITSYNVCYTKLLRTSILGLMTMIGLAEANDDPLSHSHQSLLDTLTGVFEKF